MQFAGILMDPAPGRWVERMVAAVRAFESILGVSLRQAHSGTRNHPGVEDVADPARYFKRRLATQDRWFSLFDNGAPVESPHGGLEYLDQRCLGGKMYGEGELFRVMVVAPEQPPPTAEKLLVALGDALEAESSQWTPWAVYLRLRAAHWCLKAGDQVLRHPFNGRTAAEASLPIICESTYGGLAARQPHHFGWLNYWSREVCEAVGFPARAKNCAWLEHCYQTPRGAWLLKLGASPPAPMDDEFAEILRGAYEAFPGVARRLDSP